MKITDKQILDWLENKGRIGVNFIGPGYEYYAGREHKPLRQIAKEQIEREKLFGAFGKNNSILNENRLQSLN